MLDEVSTGELTRVLTRVQLELAAIRETQDRDQKEAKADRHDIRNMIAEQMAELHLRLLEHAEKLGRVAELGANVGSLLAVTLELTAKAARQDERLSMMTNMGGKGLSITLTALLSLIVGILLALMAWRLGH